jgi:hypothetical protein
VSAISTAIAEHPGAVDPPLISLRQPANEPLVAGRHGDDTGLVVITVAGEPAEVHIEQVQGVSRVYLMSFSDGTWRMWRDTPEFSQRFSAEVSVGRAEINGSWEKSVDGGTTWEHDFTVRYSRTAR